MTIANTIQKIMPGFGAGTTYVKREGVVLAASGTIVLPATGSFSPGVSQGRIRIRSTVTNPATTTIVKITGTDGTRTEVIVPATAVTAAGELIDFEFDFVSELIYTSVTITLTLAGVTTTGTYDAEICGGP